ncbi:hypothetical protein GCM10011351_13650 [Paraliobacillus quinghaiensis]|uniref:Cellobiose phosphorylase n=2 Tax=Paraliobacillus quinghaiensis TaxID=470815 RepID=A0A917TMH7_9BACI|nr:hypothetical protein [Paraliobacillus quinghaiensis]GGM28901.1 hypothetical protein GCM10011351_13650 [Paraliobacillus quinghaiensis]
MNTIQDLHFGNAFLHAESKPVSLETVTLNEDTYFKIENYSQMNPFFMTVVSDADQWMFISSTGGLTCGRKNAESALFPYYTDDKIHDSIETTGPHTILIVNKDEKNYLWKPFSLHNSNVYKVTRNLYKNTTGNKIMFEEINHDLEVSYSYTWKSSDLFGFVKESNMVNLAESDVEIRVLDGIRNILPYGANTLLQDTKSTLVDGYKRCELVENAGLGIYTLSSILTDKAEPSESLKATTVWSKGLENPSYLLSEQQIKAFSKNEEVQTEVDVKGRRGSYYVADSILLKGHESKNWYIVAELNQNASKVEKLIKEIMENQSILQSIEADVAKGQYNLRKLVYNADGFQSTANEKASYRHFSNTLYNIMRGGIYADGYEIDREDFKAFVGNWNKEVYNKQLDFINKLPETINYNELLNLAAELNCKDFERLVFEYLPLTFSRRHGDPSRPWNKFNIEITKEDGGKELKFEGNWRDIFQNWEALSISYPAYTESIIAKFVNASTADGYNPYRITKDGIDWETLDPEDPWSNIGYWGDHQIIYLLKLMELSKSYNPEKLQDLLHKDIFVYANVPYRIKGFDALVEDPRNSIVYDDENEQRIENKTASIGSDGKLVYFEDEIYKVNLMEKLLVTVLAKFSNYVPEGGIWMNTQRPEWNDANNALVGNGLSMVTLYYMHRFQVYMSQLVNEIKEDSIEVSVEVLQMFQDTAKVLKDSEQYLGSEMSDDTRFDIVKTLGKIGETYRNSIYDNGFAGDKAALSMESLQEFIEVSMRHLKDSIKKNKRDDGLYHSYNLIRFDKENCSISYLYEMLEGQVSVLSSKALDAKETINVLDALKNSSMYREDQNSYMLYPNRELPKFLEKNVIPDEQVMSSSILQAELNKNLTRFIEKDVNGKYHFNGRFRNGEEIREALEATKEYKDKDIKVVEEIFTELFNHHAFTGRSGTFYKYEGLGSIYWHMVSKLVLATQENFEDVYCQKGMNEEAEALMNDYEALKDGIGLEKSPEEYGAFPTEAYSHTPGFAGVQQPGMTGQVKEDFISRLTELGVKVEEGLVHFKPVLLSKSEFLKETKLWSLPRNSNAADTETIQLDENSLGFTFCAVPVIYYLDDKKKIIVCYKDGTESIFEDEDTLDLVTSQTIFSREGKIDRIKVYIDGSKLK